MAAEDAVATHVKNFGEGMVERIPAELLEAVEGDINVLHFIGLEELKPLLLVSRKPPR